MNGGVVLPVDPAGGGKFGFCNRVVEAVVEGGVRYPFGFVKPVGSLHQCTIVCVADISTRGHDDIEAESIGGRHGGLLRPSVRMCPQLL